MKGKHGMNTNPMRQNATLATKLRMPVAISWIDALLDAAEDAVERAEYTNSGQALDLAIGRLRHVDDSIRGGLNAHLPVETLARFDHLLARVEDEVFRHKAMHTNPCK